MPRRTKEDAQVTRDRLIDAAELVFHAKGVSRSSLAEIAESAGLTRGAIYWHFKDKADLFNAMMDRATLPLENAMQLVGVAPDVDPLETLRTTLADTWQRMLHDAQLRRVFEVAVHQVEYVEELRAVRERHHAVREQCLADFRRAIEVGAQLRGVTLLVPAALAARGLQSLTWGAIQDWLLDTEAFDLVEMGNASLQIYLDGLGLGQPVPAAKKPTAS
jgi:TetR/AcrR family acrAB operon transcriptional repressor